MKKLLKYFVILTSVTAAVSFYDNRINDNTSLISPVFSSENAGSQNIISADFFSSVTSTETPDDEFSASVQYPDKYDLRDYGLVSAVRNQGNYGTCWAICATESLETQLLKNNYETDPDLSEWHLAYFSYTGDDSFYSDAEDIFLAGGTNTVAAAILSRWIGTVHEQTAPYDSSHVLDEDLRYSCDYQVQDVYNLHPWLSNHKRYSVSSLKELIYDQNSVSVFFNSTQYYYNPDTYSYCCLDEDANATHAVLLVGWDDNYSRNNFNSDNRPENDGAWLVKNSWGEEWGDDGYFWLSYEDYSLCEGSCFFCEPSGTYRTEYSYDDFGWVSSISADSRQTSLTGYMSNIFYADSDDNISAVGFYTTEENADYEITVYSDLSNSRIPTSGIASAVTLGTQKYTGYHTVRLDKPVTVKKGSKFSVVIKITNQTSPYNIPIEASSLTIRKSIFSSTRLNLYIPNQSESNQSYISRDGVTWSDASQTLFSYKYPEKMDFNPKLSDLYYITPGNVCIKAFTSSPEISVNRYDIDKDGQVNVIDFIILNDYFLTGQINAKLSLTNGDFDLNEDKTVNIIDVILLKDNILS